MTAAAWQAAAEASCVHCNLPVPAGRRSAFCCAGCEVVHGAIAAHGLDQFYRLREQSAPAHTTDRPLSQAANTTVWGARASRSTS